MKKLRKTNSKFSKSNQSKSLESFLELWLEVFLPTIELRQNAALFASLALNKLNFRGGWKNRWFRERECVCESTCAIASARERVCVLAGCKQKSEFHTLFATLARWLLLPVQPSSRANTKLCATSEERKHAFNGSISAQTSASACITKTYKSTELDLSCTIKRAFMFQSCLPSRSQ